MKKNVLFVLYMLLIWAVVTLGLSFVFPNQPLATGDCGIDYIFKDETDPFEYDGDTIICRVQVKAGSQVQGEACFGLTIANPNDGCYAATGLGTTHVKVSRVGEDGCKDISHVEFYPCPQEEPTDTPTATSTSTQTLTSTATVTPTSTEIVSTAINTPTPSETLETPWKFWTPTPITATPTETDWNIGRTATVSPTPFETSTPTDTLPPNEKKTPEVFLPASGTDGSDTDETMLRFGFAFVLSVIGLFMLRHIWRVLHK